MSRQYSISRRVFSSISSFTFARTLRIRDCDVLMSLVFCTLCLLHTPQKKSKEMISGDLGGHGVGPLFPIHRFGKLSFKKSRTIKPQCAGAPSCETQPTAGILWNNAMFRCIQIDICCNGGFSKNERCNNLVVH